MFSTIDFQINEAKNEIEQLNNQGIDTTKIKHQYLRSLVLLIVSEYENLLEAIFIERAKQSNDIQLTNYVKSQIEKKFRSPDLTKINATLGFFDSILKRDFMSSINNTPVNSAWDNIMKARHYIVHKQGSLNITFEELLESYPKTKTVFIEVLNQLGVQESDVV